VAKAAIPLKQYQSLTRLAVELGRIAFYSKLENPMKPMIMKGKA
jgi:hypothetical protein